jgi:AdoMet-dependent rRNA methyltransferase SPB1
LKLPETTQEVKNCCEDLRVLGKKDFRKLLKWRLSVREKFGLSIKKKSDKPEGVEEAEVASMDEEMQMEGDLARLRERESKEKKKAKRKENEKKQKEVVRMQLHMGTPMEIGMEQGGEAMFGLKMVDKAGPGALARMAKGKMNMVIKEDDATSKNKDIYMGELFAATGKDDSDDETANRLEEELDVLYVCAIHLLIRKKKSLLLEGRKLP